MIERKSKEKSGVFCATCGKMVSYDTHVEGADGTIIYFKCKNVLCDNHNHLPDNAKYDELVKRGFAVKSVVVFDD